MHIECDENHIYRVDGVVRFGINEILHGAGLVDTKFFTEFGRDRGRAVHKAVELYELGTLDENTIDPDIVGYVDAWKSYRSKVGISVLWQERKLYSPAYLFCGTPDLLGIIKKENVLVEIKTGAPQPYTALQMAAQKHLVEINFEIKIKHRYEVELMENGNFKQIEHTDKSDEQVFIALVVAQQWKKKAGLL